MNFKSSIALCALTLAACSNGSAQLTRVSEFSSSSKCARGGVRIAIGLDSNTNGTLEDSETGSTTELCTGAQAGGAGPQGPVGPAGTTGPAGTPGTRGLATLMRSSPQLPGSSCANGGVLLEFGLDDGTGGGTAGNGVLEAGEVTRSRSVCNGGMPYYPGTLTPPASPAGAFTIDASGGSGNDGNGGPGGDINVEIVEGTLGGHTKVFRTGAANAAFTVPALPAFAPGTRPLAVNANLTLNGYATRALGLASSDAHFWVDGEARLYANVAGAAVEVTSIDVAAGVTLTLPHDSINGTFVLNQDLRNAGHIRMAPVATGANTPDLTLRMSSFYGLPGSTIRTDCAAAVAIAGCQGGSLTILALRRAINQGELSARGGDGDSGGNGGQVLVSAGGGEVINTATIDASGGVGAGGPGGGGGSVNLEGYFRGVSNSGALSANGGLGTVQGGAAGLVAIDALGSGTLLNTGALSARGAACTAAASCDGGDGGSLYLTATGGDLRSNGSLDARAGDGQGFNSIGGAGGSIRVSVEQDSENVLVPLPVGDLQLSGNLDARGGSGNSGAPGGTVDVLLDGASAPLGQELELLGYTTLTTNGGSSVTNNGERGGVVRVTNTRSRWFEQLGPGGGAFLDANVVAIGGDGEEAGNGGSVLVSTQTTSTFMNPNEVAELRAATVNLRGAIAFAGQAGRGGSVMVRGAMGAVNTAAVNANGGNVSEGPVPDGGDGGELLVEAPNGAASNSGAVSANGGTSSAYGGEGGFVRVRGLTASNTATVSCNGANATFEAGSGGLIEFLSAPGNTSTASTAQLSATGGNGQFAGLRGTILIDGVDVTP